MSEAPPELTTSTSVHRGRVFAVTVDELTYADGRTVKMDVVRHPGSVVLLPMLAPDRILLVRQYRYVVDRWLWELPAGTRDAGETFEAAALRECHEEVGKVAGETKKLLGLFPSPGFCDEEMNFFLLTNLRDPGPDDAAAHQDPDEILEVRAFALGDVRRMVRSGEICDMKTVVGVGLVDPEN